ncbi:MAG: hypothetical protein D6820_10450 [Lentisphaerae bacterium]|nr:MAG: hypothetical protein D6820_10450 [Lentisphaerota bacterium]
MTMEAYTAHETIRFVKEMADAKRPFFCWASFYRPHQPYTPVKPYLEMFDASRWGSGTRNGDGIAKPPSLEQPPAELPSLFQTWHQGKNRIWRLDEAVRDHQHFRNYLAAYYALVAEIDHHIGRILQTLEQTGQLENTIIIYTADHGDFVGTHGMVEKCAAGHNVYEDTLRVPLIIAWPGVGRARQVCDDLVELVDLFPTVLDAAGIVCREQAGYPLPGQSLLPCLTGQGRVDRRFAISENRLQTTVISASYKLAVSHDPQKIPPMLFDCVTDPYELANRYHDPEYLPVREALLHDLQQWQARTPGCGGACSAER